MNSHRQRRRNTLNNYGIQHQLRFLASIIGQMMSKNDKNLKAVGCGEAQTASFATRTMRFLRLRILPHCFFGSGLSGLELSGYIHA